MIKKIAALFTAGIFFLTAPNFAQAEETSAEEEATEVSTRRLSPDITTRRFMKKARNLRKPSRLRPSKKKRAWSFWSIIKTE